jgi:hypothetical protein
MLKSAIKTCIIAFAATASALGAYNLIKGSLESDTDFKRLDAIVMAIGVGAGMGAATGAIAFDYFGKSRKDKDIDVLINDLQHAITKVSFETSSKLLDAVDALAHDKGAVRK